MKYPRISFRGATALAVLLLGAVPADAQSYGPSAQVLTVGAAEFRSDSLFVGLERGIQVDGYLYNALAIDFLPDPFYLAPLALPDGALIEETCLYAFDIDPDESVSVQLLAVMLTPEGETPVALQVGPSPSSAADGYSRSCASLSEIIRRKLDVDGDGQDDDAVWYLRASLNRSDSPSRALGGVRIRWRRQTSPPPVVPTFGDVPASHQFLEFIEAVSSSGITGGCGSGNYCPSNPLTRGQMAVFLSKALGLHWPD